MTVASWEERVGGYDPGETIGVLADQPQTDETPPVLADQSDRIKPDRLDGPPRPVHVSLVAVVVRVGGLVTPTETDEVQSNSSQAC